ncbi:MAG: aldehyde dehydrogenase family protein [Candidatus Gracilibacteria bacterium]|nr:aldehyde dehydrogenase family protein [Candidatus Gracilibacteria bacterium]
MKTIQSVNPFNQELNAEIPLISESDLDIKIKKSDEAFKSWKQKPRSEKKELFLQLAEVFEKNIEEMALLQTKEMGMLYTESLGGLQATITLTKWFANNFESILGNEEFDIDGMKGKYMYDPLGVIFGIAPWNFPFNQVLRAAIPNILAGNTVIYKHASNVPLSAQKIEDLFLEAGFPEGIYQNIFVSSSMTEYILSRKEIKGVNLTGGERAGKAVGSLAGMNLKPAVLELGGNDAFIIGDSTDLAGVAKQAAKARIANAGQKCNSSKRFIVTEKNYAEFKKYFVEAMSHIQTGDPMLAETNLAPLSSKRLVDEIHEQVQKTIQEGGVLLTGGEKPDTTGNFYPATILEVDETMTSYKEEVFGPVASLIKAKDIQDAIRIANNSDFGLCGCVYGDNTEELKSIADQIETGMVFINKPAGSKASLPFGGIKLSGFGKENGPEGLKAFTNKKVIVY